MEGSALSIGGSAGPMKSSPGPGHVERGFDAHEPVPGRATYRVDGAATDGATGRELRSPAMVVPALVLMAAAAIAEGYGWLGVLRLSGRETSAVAFAALAAVLAAVMTRRRSGRRVAGAGLLVGAAIFLLAATLSSLFVAGPVDARLVGASALVYATVALGAAAADEHRSRCAGGTARGGAMAERPAVANPRPGLRCGPYGYRFRWRRRSGGTYCSRRAGRPAPANRPRW
jgi:hypothetical protein